MKVHRLFLAVLGACLICASAHAAGPQIVEVTSKSGIKAWLVEDHKLPLISLRFAFQGGVETDPADKQGLAVLATSLLTQGAGPYDDRAFQERLAAQSIQMDISAGRDYTVGEVKTLRRAKEEAFHFLGLALTKPRFDEPTFERVRDGQLTAVKAQLANPGWQGRVALFRSVFGDHPYSYRSLGSLGTVKRLTRADAQAFVQQRLAKDKLFVSVVGAISPDELAAALDAVFAALPAQASPDTLGPALWPATNKTILVTREGTQTNILLATPMLHRDDPDWYAAEIANYILGGGGFISRLMKAVRAKEGLTYGIGTSLSSMEKASLLVGHVATDNAKVAEVLSLLKSVWQTFYDKGVTADEVTAAQDYLTGSLPLSLTSTDAIASTLLVMQTEKLGIDYLDKQQEKYRAVTRDDVQRVIAKWFNPDRTDISLVGKPESVTIDQKNELIAE